MCQGGVAYLGGWVLFLLHHRKDQMWRGRLDLSGHIHQKADGVGPRCLFLLKRVALQHVHVAVRLLPAFRTLYLEEVPLVGVFKARGSQFSGQGDLRISIALKL